MEIRAQISNLQDTAATSDSLGVQPMDIQPVPEQTQPTSSVSEPPPASTPPTTQAPTSSKTDASKHRTNKQKQDVEAADAKLPPGWRVITYSRGGDAKYKYYVSPNGQRFSTKNEARRFLEMQGDSRRRDVPQRETRVIGQDKSAMPMTVHSAYPKHSSRVGPRYQATLPEPKRAPTYTTHQGVMQFLLEQAVAGLPRGASGEPSGTKVWIAGAVPEQKVEEFVEQARKQTPANIPFNQEEALTLLHNCNYDITQTLNTLKYIATLRSRLVASQMHIQSVSGNNGV